MSTLASMYTHTADWLTTHRRWTPQPAPLDQSAAREQAQRVQLAFHCAYRRFAQRYPAWVARRFDEEFLRQAMHRWLSCQGSSTQASGVLPSGYELAWAWDRQFGLLVSEPLRTRQVAELTGVATVVRRPSSVVWRSLRTSAEDTVVSFTSIKSLRPGD